MKRQDRWLSLGLFLTTLATLLIELLDSRLLSVLTWYHLSFLAVSLAMLGMAAGAVFVFLGGERTRGAAARRLLGWLAYGFAVAIPVTHFLLLRTRIPPLNHFALEELLPLGLAIVLLTVPFLLSGATVTIALTRVGGRIGMLYGSDLIGASAGCLAIVPLLALSDAMSTALVASGLAAAGAWCFQRCWGTGRALVPAITATILVLGGLTHVWAGSPIDVAYPRGKRFLAKLTDLSIWNAYSHVTVTRPRRGAPFFWGRGKSPKTLAATTAIMLIDGDAGTPLTEWDGDPNSVSWVKYDVTALAYHLRSGDVGIIGVGGGRDILTAIWDRSPSITGIELNSTFVDILSDSHRDFAKIADWDHLRLINDEARSYLTRSEAQFDILQMSLVDTWAATGAGAFTLSENALYTIEAWQVFLNRLKPAGIFSTSRWFAPQSASETSRLLSLCVAALLERGIEMPADHIALVSRGRIATLLTSPSPFSRRDITALRALAGSYEFNVLAIPGTPPTDPRLAQILSSTSAQSLQDATADPRYDYSAPTDQRPYFFNMLKPGVIYPLLRGKEALTLNWRPVIRGNLRATLTLGVLLLIATTLAIGIIVLPLAWAGRPQMQGRMFLGSLAYFGMIGYGFMSIQIPFLQRFSVFIGHPIYTYSIILFTMILFAGVGSILSDRLILEGRRWHLGVPLAIAALLLALTLSLQPALDATIGRELVTRCLVVVALTAPVSVLLGFCFPIGMRLVSAISEDAAAWMWGINGACGVLASILAVAISMWVGIYANLVIAVALYAGLVIPARTLAMPAR